MTDGTTTRRRATSDKPVAARVARRGGGASQAARPVRVPRDTPQRRAIATQVARLGRSFTARELYESLRERSPVGLVTVYRTLELLLEQGLVREAGRRGHEALYAACDRVQHHHHLVCEVCGAVEESDVCRCDELGVELDRAHGFVLSPSVANYYGRCAGCAGGPNDPAGPKNTMSGPNEP